MLEQAVRSAVIESVGERKSHLKLERLTVGGSCVARVVCRAPHTLSIRASRQLTTLP
jgi:hypothetical protein